MGVTTVCEVDLLERLLQDGLAWVSVLARSPWDIELTGEVARVEVVSPFTRCMGDVRPAL